LKTLLKLIISSALGVLAGFISLVFFAIFAFLDSPVNIFILSLSVVIEEFTKLLFLFFLINLFFLSKNKIALLSFISAIFFGLSFSLFEFGLLVFNNEMVMDYRFLYSTLIHTVSSLLIVLAIGRYVKVKKLSTASFIFFTLALFIHLCYNLIVLKSIS